MNTNINLGIKPVRVEPVDVNLGVNLGVQPNYNTKVEFGSNDNLPHTYANLGGLTASVDLSSGGHMTNINTTPLKGEGMVEIGGFNANKNVGLHVRENSNINIDTNTNVNGNININIPKPNIQVTAPDLQVNLNTSPSHHLQTETPLNTKFTMGFIPQPLFEDEPHTTPTITDSLRSYNVCVKCTVCGEVAATDVNHRYNILNIVLGCLCVPAWLAYMSWKRKDLNCYNADHYCSKCEKYIDTYIAC